MGKPPPTLVQYLQGTSSIDAVDSLLTTRTEIHVALQHRLRKAQEAMKTTADKHHHDVSFAVGDWVYVRLRPYRKTSLAPTYTKLTKRFYGPFQVLERIEPVAYKLQLPVSSRIHPVSHISLLKLHQEPLPPSPAELSRANFNNHSLVTPLTILDWKCDNSVSPPIIKVLVQWDGLAPEDTSWELWDDILQTQP
ncbi:uncharacterized protein [Glycine max]|uniref:uncharacterized protein n=1 Tax=Glycine max TaxID=3847 RepID=UPI001B356F6C|nr:uncharacterized protein LOC121172965 [Glycine max]